MKWKFLLIIFLIVIIYLNIFKITEGVHMTQIKTNANGLSVTNWAPINGINKGIINPATCLEMCKNDTTCNIAGINSKGECFLSSQGFEIPMITTTYFFGTKYTYKSFDFVTKWSSYVKIPDE